MLGSAEDEGSSGELYYLLLIINVPFPALEHLSTLTVHNQSQDVLDSMPDLDGEVVTLTHLPRSRWQTLLNLDVIQVRLSISLSATLTLNYFG